MKREDKEKKSVSGQHAKRNALYTKTMASITQEQLFAWSDIEELGDLERLKLVLDTLPDEPLMKALESKRGQSDLNKHPIRAVWNSLIDLVVLQHRSIESLRRELMRNPSLRRLCGFNLAMGAEAVPSAGSYSRFFRTLVQHTPLIQQIFEELVGQCYEQFDEFGKNLAIDGKALPGCAQRAGKVEVDLRGEVCPGRGSDRADGLMCGSKIRKSARNCLNQTVRLEIALARSAPRPLKNWPAEKAQRRFLLTKRELDDNKKETQDHQKK